MTHLHPSTPDPSDAADHAVDRLLDTHFAATPEELGPSSGFVASVMESIHAEATEPPTIAFPWRRALPGAIAILCGLLAFLVLALREAGTASKTAAPAAQSSAISWPRLTHELAFTPHEVALCSILLAACLSIAAVAASFRLAGRSD